MQKNSMNHMLGESESGLIKGFTSIQNSRIPPQSREVFSNKSKVVSQQRQSKCLKPVNKEDYQINHIDHIKQPHQNYAELNFDQNKYFNGSEKQQYLKPKIKASKFYTVNRKHVLKDIITQQKVKNIKHTFIQKLKRNNIYSKPVTYHSNQQRSVESFLDIRGIQIKQFLRKIIDIVLVINVFLSMFVATLSLVFDEVAKSSQVQLIWVIGLVIYLIQIILNFTTRRQSLGRRLQTLREISRKYIQEDFYIDAVNFIVILLSFIVRSQFLNVCRIFIFLKLLNCSQKINNIEVYFISNYYKQQYWQLIKVFLLNFIYAHILSIILISMTNVNPTNNWMLIKGISKAAWYQRYVWSYYWSTTIMLTIGFGDIVPACFQQALIMIFINIISCIILVYNIYRIGKFINKICSQGEQKSKNWTIFKNLEDKHNLSYTLSQKIANYIDEESTIKKMSTIQQQVEFIQKLPTKIKQRCQQQAYGYLFYQLYFFGNLMQETLYDLAHNIKIKIAQPFQELLNQDTNFDLLILKNGEIECKPLPYLMYYWTLPTNKVKILQNNRPLLLHTNFITKQRSKYRIISTAYSTINYLEFESLISSLKKFSKDFEYYCQLKDKNKSIVDQFQIFRCKNCNTKHTQFDCPKYHFIPIKKHVIDKYLRVYKREKNKRQNQFQRNKNIQNDRYCVFLQTQKLITRKIKDTHKKELLSSPLSNVQNIQQSKINPIKMNYEQCLDNNKSQITEFKYHQLLDKNTQIIKSYITKMFRLQDQEDEVWEINSDKMKDYSRWYFTQDNPCNLKNKFSKDIRIVASKI